MGGYLNALGLTDGSDARTFLFATASWSVLLNLLSP
jgi:hypothetical protein